MEDKLNISLDDVIKQQKSENKNSKQKNNKDDYKGNKNHQNRQQKMRSKTKFVNAPSAREKAQQLRKNKVGSFGRESRGHREPFTNGKKFTTKSRENRAEREDWKNHRSQNENRKPSHSNRLQINNLNNSISNEDLNVLFRNIGPLKELRREYDEFGRPLGSAVVVYEKIEDATKAYQEYNKAELDDNVLVINYLPSTSSESRGVKASMPGKLKLVNMNGQKVIKKS